MVRAVKKKVAGMQAAGPVVGNVLEQFREALQITWRAYSRDLKSDQRLLLIDTLCGGLVTIGLVQVLFIAVIRDTFPFNAFLAGFISCVGQFVLLISLRLQLREQFAGISSQRAFGEFVLASLVLHFICLHFIN
ncbi:ADL261Cp [Eremothecium gossypii ATCC 10895]|uniref:Dolichyl-diphosphooligosaccharide--protein glycosyltransferase subunit OST2 n=1 Tax=Eremothecium gossypii (strain ATCC 10895 / CBS 109.51 / FGSC 9923 / NRRL Y-1056) TaxID=284811 RepID=Q75B38_EREGS|nr:ADL261Cp [Eremothecium gossypii ATCC 10895]AAS51659.1 ADL261Cp [Eremothecium gossypii ATCC 10895]